MTQDTPNNPTPQGPRDAATPRAPEPTEPPKPIEPTPTPTPGPVAHRREAPATDETVKETIESIVIAFILAFVFRAFVVEPFIIPTGSMAPTMLGTHAQINCPSCGYHFDVGVDQSQLTDESLVPITSADCPMCNYEVTTAIGTKARSGDRILVDKFSYHLTDPSRWDIVVFKAPQDDEVNGVPAPRANFIKRLVGLPGERVAFLDGNVFIAPAGTNDFAIARKTDPDTNRHWQTIQRAVWQPIYHSQYIPIEDGTATGPGRDQLHAFRVPWQINRGDWDLGTDRRPRRVYTFQGGEGEIQFKMSGAYGTVQYNDQRTKYPYNQMMGSTNPIEDIRLACAFTPLADNATLTLATTARLDQPGSGPETLAASLDTDGRLTLQAIDEQGNARDLVNATEVGKLKRGIACEIELWLVDDEVSVWINGERRIIARFDLTWQQLAERLPQPRLPKVTIAVTSDGPVELRRVELDRDLYYDPSGYSDSGFARAQAKRIDGRLEVGPNPLDLRTQTRDYDAELFCLGDNQPASKDGRDWYDVNPWVQRRYFDGDERAGLVPRSLLVGRAFMVYYPAPHGDSPQAKGIFPDFGRMRFVH
ncbi:MAG: signal peptidase I [Phycisphaeraceae bacterium]